MFLTALIVADEDENWTKWREVEPRTKRGVGEEWTVEPKSKTEDKGEKLELSNEKAELELEIAGAMNGEECVLGKLA